MEHSRAEPAPGEMMEPVPAGLQSCRRPSARPLSNARLLCAGGRVQIAASLVHGSSDQNRPCSRSWEPHSTASPAPGLVETVRCWASRVGLRLWAARLGALWKEACFARGRNIDNLRSEGRPRF